LQRVEVAHEPLFPVMMHQGRVADTSPASATAKFPPAEPGGLLTQGRYLPESDRGSLDHP
jgi:hypothetical protein